MKLMILDLVIRWMVTRFLLFFIILIVSNKDNFRNHLLGFSVVKPRSS